MPKGSREWWRVTRDEADAIDIDIYGDIGESFNWLTGEKEGRGAKAFLDEVRAAEGKAINLHVNSGGGSVYDAFAMMSALAAHRGKVTAYVDGLAASAASYLVAAADEVVISSEGWMMIHRASVFDIGNAEQLKETADWLEKIDAQVAGIYAKRSASKTEAEFAEAMAETTWFTADEAVDWGLADRVEEAVAAAAWCFTMDSATLDSAPEGVKGNFVEGKGFLYKGAPPQTRRQPAAAEDGSPCDVSENIPSDSGEPGEQEPPAAKDRVVAIDNRLLKVRARNENLRERGKNA